LRIGVLPSLGFAIAPPMVAAMRESEPDVSFELSTLHSEEMTAALLEKRFDLCIGFDDEFDSRIRCQTINSVNLSLLAPRGMFAGEVDSETGADLDGLSPAMLDGKEMIGLRDSGPVADRIDAYLEQAGVEPVVTVTAQTYYVAAELVKLGAGCAIVDGFTARRFASDTVDTHRLRGAPTLPFVAMTLAEQSDTPMITSSLKTLRSLFG
jgi:DNA-binding transcriptional LysR family regulator